MERFRCRKLAHLDYRRRLFDHHFPDQYNIIMGDDVGIGETQLYRQLFVGCISKAA